MDRKEILKDVNRVFRNILDNDDLTIFESTTAQDVDDWDSLTHIQLVVAVEKNFSIRFNSKEILSWENVGQMLDSIEAKSI